MLKESLEMNVGISRKKIAKVVRSKEFCNRGHGCHQLPSSLRRLQATPLLQTSLVRSTKIPRTQFKDRKRKRTKIL